MRCLRSYSIRNEVLVENCGTINRTLTSWMGVVGLKRHWRCCCSRCPGSNRDYSWPFYSSTSIAVMRDSSGQSGYCQANWTWYPHWCWLRNNPWTAEICAEATLYFRRGDNSCKYTHAKTYLCIITCWSFECLCLSWHTSGKRLPRPVVMLVPMFTCAHGFCLY